MSFSKAKIQRFNEIKNDAPPPGTYNPQFDNTITKCASAKKKPKILSNKIIKKDDEHLPIVFSREDPIYTPSTRQRKFNNITKFSVKTEIKLNKTSKTPDCKMKRLFTGVKVELINEQSDELNDNYLKDDQLSISSGKNCESTVDSEFDDIPTRLELKEQINQRDSTIKQLTALVEEMKQSIAVNTSYTQSLQEELDFVEAELADCKEELKYLKQIIRSKVTEIIARYMNLQVITNTSV